MNDVLKIFSALSDKNRLRIVMMLMNKEMCVCEITQILGLSASTVSNHLSILKDIGLASDSKDGKWVNYKIGANSSDPKIQNVLLLLQMWLKEDEQIKFDSILTESTDRNQICSK
jgi:ArsR family transcriptional regulator